MNVRLVVSGIVQGVGYRFFTKHIADQLGVLGYVKNLADGNVEVIAVTEKTSIMEFFIEKLKKGPVPAYVDNIYQESYNSGLKYYKFTIEY